MPAVFQHCHLMVQGLLFALGPCPSLGCGSMGMPVHTHTISQHCTYSLGMPSHRTAMSQHRWFWAHLITAPAPPHVGEGKPVYMPALSQLGHKVGWARLSSCLPHPINAMWWREHTFAHPPRSSTATQQHRQAYQCYLCVPAMPHGLQACLSACLPW